MKKFLLLSMGFTSFSMAFAQTTNYNYTGAVQMYVVPPCVSSVSIQASGAQGAAGSPGVAGGLGGQVYGEMSVSFGDTLFIYVGGQNGYNGGGLAGTGGPNISGNGGGASDVRFND